MKKRILLSSLILVSGQTYAASYYTDARNAAMGGTGVASSTYHSAMLSNPALMTKFADHDDFSFILPSVGAEVADPNKAINRVDDIQDAFDSYESAIDNRQGDPIAKASHLKSLLEKLDKNQITADAGAAFGFTIPTDVFTLGVFTKAYADISATAHVAQSDLDLLGDVSNGILPPPTQVTDLDSEAIVLGALVSDIGISFAKPLQIKDFAFSVGITPKIQRIETYNYDISVNNYDVSEIGDERYRSNKSAFNMDIGFSTDLSENITLGLVAKNLFSQSVETAVVNNRSYVYKITPAVTTAIAYRGELLTVAADLDLTANKGFTHHKKHQFAGVGAEFNALGWMQVRAGYRSDMTGDKPNMITAGLGFSPFNIVKLDLTGMAGTNKAYGAAMQLSLTF